MEETKKTKKQLWDNWWSWAIGIVICIAIFTIPDMILKNTNISTSTKDYQYNSTNIINEPQNDVPVEVTVVDFSIMKREDISQWFDENNIKGTITDEYSSTIPKGAFISQSIPAETVIHEKDKITVKYSLGKQPTTEERNALKKAESYLKTMPMSKKGLYNQLTSSIEGFTKESAQYAIDNITTDWNINALEKAKSYQKTMNMSKKAIYNQLVSSIEGFTKSEAQYAIDHLED